MTNSPPDWALIADELSDFLCFDSLITLATASPSLVPDLARAVACFVERSPFRIRLAIDETHAGHLLPLLQQTARIAVVFSSPRSHRTIQIKSTDVKIMVVPSDDLAEIARRSKLQDGLLEDIGFGDPFACTFHQYEPSKLHYLLCQVHECYNQTPGPHAGKPYQAQK